jgi:hypothetical protein
MLALNQDASSYVSYYVDRHLRTDEVCDAH